MYVLSQKGLLDLLMLLSEKFLTLYLPMCLPFFLASMCKGVPFHYWYMIHQKNTESSLGPYSWLTLGIVKGSGLRECAFLIEKKKKKEQSILDVGEKTI